MREANINTEILRDNNNDQNLGVPTIVKVTCVALLCIPQNEVFGQGQFHKLLLVCNNMK